MLTEIVADASAYYLLGYTPTRTEDDGKFHKISVKVKRPGRGPQGPRGGATGRPTPREVTTAAERRRDASDARVSPTRSRRWSRRRRAAWQTSGSASRPGRTARPRLLVTWEPPAACAGRWRAQPVTTLDVERVVPDGKAIGSPAEAVASATGAQAEDAVAAIDVAPGETTLRFTARAKDEDARRSLDAERRRARRRPRVPLGLGSPVVRRARSPLEFRTHPPGHGRRADGVARVPPDRPRAGRRAVLRGAAREATVTVDLLNKGGPGPASACPRRAQSEGRMAVRTARWQPGAAARTCCRLTAQAGEDRVERLEAFEVVP